MLIKYLQMVILNFRLDSINLQKKKKNPNNSQAGYYAHFTDEKTES